MPVKKILLAVLIMTVVTLYFTGGGVKYLDINLYRDIYRQSPVSTLVLFFVVFLVSTSCSLPSTGILTVFSGIIFGMINGFCISLMATTLGGTLAFYSARYMFGALIQRRFAGQLELVNKGINKEGAFYLFGLRMIPVIPFWLLNLLMGLTSMRARVFVLATLGGMIPILLILTYTGSRLGKIEEFSMAAIITPDLLLALGLLATFPFLAKYIVGLTRRFKD